MNLSLSILAPVRNVQAKLQASIQRLLEVLAELGGRFEVLLIDDGSTDATCEVAVELARDYPQVKFLRQAAALGWAGSVAKYAHQTCGEFLIIHCGGMIAAQDVIALWRLRHIISASASKPSTPLNGKSWRLDPESKHAELEADKIQLTTLLNGSCIHAQAANSNFLLLRRQQLNRLESCLAAIPRSTRIEVPSTKRPTAPAAHTAARIKPPSFLSQLKTFTLGE